jgi:hypothetical protein
MQRVSINKLKPGMVLAKSITNESGMVLLSEGTALTDSLIMRLNRMDITSVSIEGASTSDKSREERLSELDRRFSKTEKEAYMDVIKGAIKAHIEEVYQ